MSARDRRNMSGGNSPGVAPRAAIEAKLAVSPEYGVAVIATTRRARFATAASAA